MHSLYAAPVRFGRCEPFSWSSQPSQPHQPHFGLLPAARLRKECTSADLRQVYHTSCSEGHRAPKTAARFFFAPTISAKESAI